MIRRLLKKSLTARRVLRGIRLRRLPSMWKGVGGRRLLKAKTRSGTPSRILMATSVGSHLPGTTLESLIAAALKIRGAQPEFLLCDGVLPACQDCTLGISIGENEMARHGPRKSLCGDCFRYPEKMLSSLGFKVHRYSDYLRPEDHENARRIAAETPVSGIGGYSYGGMAVGEHSMAGALRFYARGDLEGCRQGEPVLRRYFEAGLLTAMAMDRLLRENAFEAAVFHHGIYIPQGIIGDACRLHGVRVTNWNPAYRKKSFIFSHHRTYHHALMEEPVSNWEGLEWTEKTEALLLKYLKSRKYGTEDWIYFHKKPLDDSEKLKKDLHLTGGRPCIGILTNVVWDAQLHYPSNIFGGMLEWLLETLRYFEKRDGFDVIVRVHPAEVHGGNPSRQRVCDEVKKHFPSLPQHIRIVGPDDPASTYTLMSACNAVIVYGTKTGVELSAMGIPVIVAGEAWVRGKGITIDPSSRKAYFDFLDTLPAAQLDPRVVERARKYAFHFFFRRMIPLDLLLMKKGWPLFRHDLRDFSQLAPGVDPGLDVICEGILHSAPYIYPCEKIKELQ